jgi:hypothetical protein
MKESINIKDIHVRRMRGRPITNLGMEEEAERG